jgi:hypothetical protein
VRRAACARILSVLTTLAITCIVLTPSPARADASEQSTLLALVNALRTSRGLRALAVHAELQSAASDWAQHMAAAQRISHSALDARISGGWQHLGENVAVDVSVASAEVALEASPPHLENLVNPAFDYIGIGVAHGADGAVYVAQDFMQLGAAPPAPAPRQAPRVVRSRAPAPSRPVRAVPPPPAPPPPPQPSPRLADVFGRLRDLDATGSSA